MADQNRSLDQQMRELLTQLAVCSHVPASGYEPRSRSGAAGSRDLRGGDKGPDSLAHRYGPPFHDCTATCRHFVAKDDHQRAGVIEQARHELEHLRGHGTAEHRPAGETIADRDERIIRDYQGWSPTDLEASREAVTASDVRKIRRRADRDTEDGHPLNRVLTTDEKRRRARERRVRGVPTRDIAADLGVSQTLIMRWTADLMKRAA